MIRVQLKYHMTPHISYVPILLARLPPSAMTIKVPLAIRKALRRYAGSEMGEPT
jgi:hypothetical protein